MLTLNNVLIIASIALGLGIFLNAYFKGKKIIRKIRDQACIRNFPVE